MGSALINGTPVKWSPAGLSDNLDSSNVFPGAMGQLTNLIPDPTTKNLWQCRPVSISLTTFGSFSTPGFISVSKVIGTKIYGMIASAANANHDEPFAYDLVTGTFSAITGITAANTPLSPATTGDWTPPTMDLVGTKLVVTHPGYTGAAGVYFGWFDISDLTAITWNGGNTTTNGLPSVPVAVKQFYNRAYFLVNPATGNPGAYYTDVLTLTITSGTQILTFGDNVKLTALGALALNNQLGGIIQSLIVFKGVSNMYQITGAGATGAGLALVALVVLTAFIDSSPRRWTIEGMPQRERVRRRLRRAYGAGGGCGSAQSRSPNGSFRARSCRCCRCDRVSASGWASGPCRQ
jgi:hypothetical protein